LPNSADEVLVSSLLNGTQTSDSLLVYGSVSRMNLFTGKMSLEVKNPGNVFAWLADYDGVIRVGVTQEGKHFKVLYREGKNSPWRVVSEFKYDEDGFSPECFARDNRNLLVRADGDGDTEGLYVFNVGTGKLGELVFRHTKADLSRVFVSPDKRDVIGVACEAERPEAYWFNPQLKALQASVDKVLTNTVNRLMNTTRDWTKAVFFAGSDRDPGSYYLVDTSSANIQKLSDVAEWIHPGDMAEMKPIEFTARDGLKIHGYLTLPAGCSGKNLPLIVNPHGGPAARNTWGFDREVQFLANRGYAVLRVNFRGSTGYGNAFLEAGFRQWGLKQQDDITDGVKWAIAQGIADPKRIAIFGVSYGGFAALTGLEKTPELYRCGISYAGVVDVLRAVDPTAPTLMMVKSFLTETIGDPRKDKAALKESSPLKHVDQIRVPVFLAYGELDPKVPIATARTLAAQLKKQGHLYDFMVKADEGHGFVKEANRIEFWCKVDEFLKANLN
jgi:dipeptidyl aminopeptidase/acylaminoacyl peptidase